MNYVKVNAKKSPGWGSQKPTMTSEGNKGLTQGFSFLPCPLSGANKTPIFEDITLTLK